MTEQQAIEKFMAGSPIILVEYRSSKPEEIKYRDKDTGKPMVMAKLTHNVEMGSESFPVQERTGEQFDALSYKAPFTKGQRCVLLLDSFYRDKGNWNVRGKLEALEINGKVLK